MKKIFSIVCVLFLFVSLVFSDEVIRYIDPDSAVGGNGTTWALAYDSLFDWEAAEQTDLVTAGDWHHVYCRSSSGTADTTATIISDWTTGAANYILIEAASTDRANADGWDTAKYRYQRTLTVREGDTKIEGLQIEGVAWAHSINFDKFGSSGTAHIIGCRFKSSNNGVEDIEINLSTLTIYVYNCILGENDNTLDHGIQILACSAAYIYNNTINDRATGILIATGYSATIKNNAIFQCTDDIDDVDGNSIIDYNASDDNDGTNNIAESGGGAAWPLDFEGAGTGDFRLKSTSNLVGAALYNPGSGLYFDDIEGTDRGASNWDVGAYEYPNAPSEEIKHSIVIRLLSSMWFAEVLRVWAATVLFCILSLAIRRFWL